MFCEESSRGHSSNNTNKNGREKNDEACAVKLQYEWWAVALVQWLQEEIRSSKPVKPGGQFYTNTSPYEERHEFESQFQILDGSFFTQFRILDVSGLLV